MVLLAFGFSNCGEVCPITLATLAGARRKLGAPAADVQVVYVTVDPERDDAAQMRKFLGNFDHTFVGGVGTRAQIDAAQRSYGISSTKNVSADGSYTIGHSSSIYMIDRNGGLRAVILALAAVAYVPSGAAPAGTNDSPRVTRPRRFQ